MKKCDVILKDGLKFLVNTYDIKKLPIEPTIETPLLTHFHKWSGKKRLLYFSNEQDFANNLPILNLKHNIFAKLLSSPMRLDKFSKIKIPRDLLLQLKVQALKSNSSNNENSNKLGRLVPMLVPNNKTQSSYVANNLRVIYKSNLTSLLPKFIINSNIRYFELSDIELNKEIFAIEYKNQLESLVKSKLETFIKKQSKNPKPVLLKNWDVLITYNANDDHVLKFKKLKNEDNSIIIILNLKSLENESLDVLINGVSRDENQGIILKTRKDGQLIKLIYNLVTFLK